ncbi:MAG: hypothetical protein GF309_11730 [Candidatus Lokiarchaeota archaeon]|nr:hypothetical protein [Candidatus Lokiarchaeota archaeon]
MQYLKILSPLSRFAEMISTYFVEIWDFLILIGRISGAIVVLAGAILWFTEANIGKGRSLVMSGIILSIVVQYFVMYPPDFVLG